MRALWSKTLKGQHTFDWWSNSPTQLTLSNCISNYSSGHEDSKNVYIFIPPTLNEGAMVKKVNAL